MVSRWSRAGVVIAIVASACGASVRTARAPTSAPRRAATTTTSSPTPAPPIPEGDRATAARTILREGVAGFRFGMSPAEAERACVALGGSWSTHYTCEGARVHTIEGVDGMGSGGLWLTMGHSSTPNELVVAKIISFAAAPDADRIWQVLRERLIARYRAADQPGRTPHVEAVISEVGLEITALRPPDGRVLVSYDATEHLRASGRLAPPRRRQAGVDEIASQLHPLRGAIAGCGRGSAGVLSVEMTLDGQTGRVVDFTMSGPPAATVDRDCVAAALRSVQVAPFERPTMRVTFPYRIR